ncbi:flavin-binding monooxygenase-like-domain-containing protein [Diplogelasinospora grovesii]|uniref:Flavin-binding monooxygenase-like-domain-containing protein n=1 Tax=Diplogelasinospora grovesii TaxID=303347 RepID=A0AAN6MXJ6_9PEZI|nr:flavin-binding monooxygenase-like-domain-containing protein [Diplogelasinospora grovesii]
MAAHHGSAGLGMRVGIIGAGPLGVVAAKNLAEEGFEVTVFERAEGVGGLWRQTTNTQQTSVLPNTFTNTSKFTGAMADFPMPDDYPVHPSADQIQKYFQGYAKAFDIKRHIRFSTEVVAVAYDNATKTWRLTVRSVGSPDERSDETFNFDRLVVATGSFKKPLIPDIKGQEQFEGEILHSQAFKDPTKYRDKTVVVVGLGNTSADSISALIGVGVKRLIVSHRHKAVIIPRVTKEGKILEFTLTFRLLMLIYWLQKISKGLAATIVASEFNKLQDASYPALRKHRACANDRKLPAAHSVQPVVSDDLASHFIEGRLESAPGITAISGPRFIRFADGTEAKDVDVILLCTGLQPDLGSLMPSEFDPYNPSLAPKSFGILPSRYTDERRVARLYQGFISLQCPHQLAFLGSCIAKRPNFQLYDLITMALAQLWAGNYPLPSQGEMERSADDFMHDLAGLIKKGDVKLTGIMGAIEYDQWLNDVAGTRLYSHLGNWFSSDCWRLWWNDRKLYKTLVGGIVSAHMLRLFDSKGRGRKAWPGARDAIMEANERARNWKSEHFEEWKSEHWKGQKKGNA